MHVVFETMFILSVENYQFLSAKVGARTRQNGLLFSRTPCTYTLYILVVIHTNNRRRGSFYVSRLQRLTATNTLRRSVCILDSNIIHVILSKKREINRNNVKKYKNQAINKNQSFVQHNSI